MSIPGWQCSVSTVEHCCRRIGGRPHDRTGRGSWIFTPGLAWTLPWVPLPTADFHLCPFPGMDCTRGSVTALPSSVSTASELLNLRLALGTPELTPAHVEDVSWGQAFPLCRLRAPSSLVNTFFSPRRCLRSLEQEHGVNLTHGLGQPG